MVRTLINVADCSLRSNLLAMLLSHTDSPGLQVEEFLSRIYAKSHTPGWCIIKSGYIITVVKGEQSWQIRSYM